MSDAFIGQIMIFAGNFAPRNWAFCDGQLLSISQNTALFSILGTTYGGDGRVTFGLPDLRGRVPVHPGQGPGLSNVTLGQVWGVQNTSLTVSQLPSHAHPIAALPVTGNVTGTVNCFAQAGDSRSAAGNLLAADNSGDQMYKDGTVAPNATLASSSFTGAFSGGTTAATNTGITGSNLPVAIQPPSLGVYFIICLSGIFPSRN